MAEEIGNPFVGDWAYRSLLNDSNLATDFDKLEFGRGALSLRETGSGTVGGSISGPGWSLALRGSAGFGSPMQVRFQGRGLVGGEEWVYDYIGWLVPPWPSSTDVLERAAIVGSVTRTVPHSNGKGGIAPAGVVCSFYATRQT